MKTLTTAERDVQYRMFLEIPLDAPLPKALGQCNGHAHTPLHRRKLNYVEPNAPREVDLDACDMSLLWKRRSAAFRAADGAGDTEPLLAEYVEAIGHVCATRDNTTNPVVRLAACSYLIRLRDRRDAALRSAGKRVLAASN